MSEVTAVREDRITKTVTVEFDPDNMPEFVRGGKEYRLSGASFVFEWSDTEWRAPWGFKGERAQKLKDGSWGKPGWVNLWDMRDMKRELCAEYRPATTISITEKESN